MEIEVVKFDNLGRGIGYNDKKIVFIPKTAPGDIVEIEIIKSKKTYQEGRLKKIIRPSKLRKEVLCPYFLMCGGCDLMHISLSETLDYKLLKVNEIFKNNNINFEIKDIIKSNPNLNYRNKVTLKIKNREVGFYQSETHDLVKIDYCYLCNKVINEIIKDIDVLNICDGEIKIRVNYKDEVLIIINSKDELGSINSLLNKYKIVGIIYNDKCIYGDDFFIDKIGNYLFKVSYNAFFQVNPYICLELFKEINKYSKDNKNVLDLYCGVGTLAIVANKEKALGVEVISNAIKDAFVNKCLNNQNNIDFICSDTLDILDKITDEYDLIILDPPRSGVKDEVLEKIMLVKPKKIIYVSCNPLTLARDLKKILPLYDIKTCKLLDMFSWSEHVESVILLQRKD